MTQANMLVQEDVGDSMHGLTAKIWSGVQSKPKNEEDRWAYVETEYKLSVHAETHPMMAGDSKHGR